MPIKRITKLLISALNRKQEGKAYQMWLKHFQYFVKHDTFMPFNEFYQVTRNKEQPQTSKTNEEIMQDVDAIRQMMMGGDKNGDI